MKHLSLMILIALVACAQPKYPPSAALPPPDNNKGQMELCQVPMGNGCAALTWLNTPTSKTYGRFILKTGRPNIADGSLLPEDPASTPQILLWMPSMGHSSSVQPVVKRLDRGTFEVSQVFFSMQGTWEIHIQIKEGARLLDEAIFNFTHSR